MTGLLLAAASGSPGGGGYRPFLDPLPIDGAAWWLLLIPLALGISIAYKAIRVWSMKKYWPNVLMLTAQIVAAMVLLVAGVHVVVEWIVPALWAGFA